MRLGIVRRRTQINRLSFARTFARIVPQFISSHPIRPRGRQVRRVRWRGLGSGRRRRIWRLRVRGRGIGRSGTLRPPSHAAHQQQNEPPTAHSFILPPLVSTEEDCFEHLYFSEITQQPTQTSLPKHGPREIPAGTCAPSPARRTCFPPARPGSIRRRPLSQPR